ncbi:MAG: hypothetical protein IPM53_17530 [Anaerolineaceae bacterium]|nr:hypothetical protein [Anaerolineaceae bacterium]
MTIPVLLHTKLLLPQPRPFLVQRSTLLQKLAAGQPGKLTLVSAPPGFGKTTLIADFLARFAAGEMTSWLSLDTADNDPLRFFAYVIAALQTAVPTLGHTATTLLTAPQPAPLETVLTLLCNEINQVNGRLTLILDDYHSISSTAIHDALTFWLDYLPPNLHLILTTRADPPLPLARLRVRGELTELRAADLRFSAAEAAAFLHHFLGIDLAPEAVDALEQRTEGWIAGLQLAALSLRGRDDLPGFIQAFTGSHIYVLDYLVDEVLRQQPDDVLRFLQETAVLDQLNAALCTAVTGRADSDDLLRQLYQANLFLEALDDHRGWFRFHALFRDVLLLQLQTAQPQRLPQLHRRACSWYAQNGQIDLALRHALAANDTTYAADLVEQNAQGYLDRGDYFTVRAWLDQLSPETRRARPWLTIIYGTILTITGHLTAAERLLQETAVFQTPQNLSPHLQAELGLWQGTMARFRGNWQEAVRISEQTLALASPERHGTYNSLLINLLMGHIQRGDLTAVESLVPQIKADSSETYLLLALGIPYLQYHRGQLALAVQHYHQVVRQAEVLQSVPSVILGIAHAGLGEIAYEQNRLPEAINHLSQAISHLQNTIEQITIARAAGRLAQARLAAGEGAAVFAPLDEVTNWLEQMRLADLGFSIVLAYQRALIYLQLGDVAAAGQSVISKPIPGITIGRSEEALIQARLHLAQGQPAQALPILALLQTEAANRKWTGMQLEIAALLALVHQAQGNQAAALADLIAVLPLAEREGYQRTFLDEGEPMRQLLLLARHQGGSASYLDRLLAAFSTAAPLARGVDVLPEALTARELELLQLIAGGSTNREIANQLGIALPTVKKHVSNILVKLDVTNRTQAIARARELGMIAQS